MEHTDVGGCTNYKCPVTAFTNRRVMLKDFGEGSVWKLPWTSVRLHVGSAAKVSREAVKQHALLYAHKETPSTAKVIPLGKTYIILRVSFL